MSPLMGHGLPSQDVINTTEGSFTHTQTDIMLQEQQPRTEGERGKKQAMTITRPKQDGSVVVWMRTLQSKLLNYK